MSRKKADKKKKVYRSPREIAARKDKIQTRIELTIAGIIAVIFLGWFVWSIYDSVTRENAAEASTESVAATQVDFTDYQNYTSSLQTGFSS